ncbi:UDP-N-acetylglucosamine-peptide N-acetylglucosaminyltransferase [Paraburkholderia sediminicola]|uniref:UDP-N-acetylglucosamine-peptide N-acetylglucosaminyltransferase n=1 Tax=Paraburkholderia rhynchosiae TaxID=487049 RepID=A0ACC7NCD9_9BURK
MSLEYENLDTEYARAYAIYRAGEPLVALDILRTILAIDAHHIQSLNLSGVINGTNGNLDESVRLLSLAVRDHPDRIELRSNLARSLIAARNPGAAEQHLLHAVKLAPEQVAGWSTLATVLVAQNKRKQAHDAYIRALRLDGRDGATLSQAINNAGKIAQWSDDEWFTELAGAMISVDAAAGLCPFDLLRLPGMTSQELRRCAYDWARERYAGALAERPLAGNKRATNEPLIRIGYASADFYDHATIVLLKGVLAAHDRTRFRIHCYSYGPQIYDASRNEVEQLVDKFIDISALSDEQAARRIFDDQVDILVDLKGYTGHERVGISAWRPAPVVVNWLGYPGTLGHERLADYIIGDRWVTPAEDTDDFSELLAVLPMCYQPNDRTRTVGSFQGRAHYGLPEHGFVFASFNELYKLTPQMFDVWCDLLRETEGSVLWMLARSEEGRQNIREAAALRDISRERIVFAPIVKRDAHLARLQAADLFLDSFPVTAHTTGSDALWAGVPFVTMRGETFASRVASSLLAAADLPELACGSIRQYHEIALALVRMPGFLAHIKEKVVAARSSHLFDSSALAAGLERLYVKMLADRANGVRRPIFA